MAITGGGQYNEVDNVAYVSGSVSVTNTQIEAKVGASPLSGRQSLIIYNASTVTMYVGPTGITGATNAIPIFPQQERFMSVGENIRVYLIANTAGPHTAIIQELS